MIDPEIRDQENRLYGVWPSVAGLLFGGGIIVLMFVLADGFA